SVALGQGDPAPAGGPDPEPQRTEDRGQIAQSPEGPSSLSSVLCPLSSSPAEPPAGELLVPLVNRLASMQTQMFDQFQQALAMVLSAFGAWHSDQMGLVHRE